MKDLVFVTGNMDKVKWVSKFLGYELPHQKLDLVELQDIDPRFVLEHKAREAYRQLQKPVLVEDTSVIYHAMGKLPGPFIKFFQSELGNEGQVKLMNAYQDRGMTQTVIFGIFDGQNFTAIEASGKGTMAKEVRENARFGFGFDAIFIPEGQNKTRGEMTEEEYADAHPRGAAVLKLAEFLNN